jgi:hypothetical protein
MTYFDIPYFSNSGIKGEMQFSSPLALEIGTQFDNLVCGVPQPAVPEFVWEMFQRFNAHQIGASMVKARQEGKAQFQHEFYRVITLRGQAVGIKIKPDFLIKGVMQIDLKTTAASTINGIESAIKNLDYLVQMGLYHKVARVKQSGLFFISKTSQQVYYRPCTPAELEWGWQEFLRRLEDYITINGLWAPEV